MCGDTELSQTKNNSTSGLKPSKGFESILKTQSPLKQTRTSENLRESLLIAENYENQRPSTDSNVIRATGERSVSMKSELLLHPSVPTRDSVR